MKGLKKILGLTLAAMMTISLVGCSSSSDNTDETTSKDKLQQIKDAGVLVVGMSADYAPYEFHKKVDGKDKIVGFDITMAEEIAKDIGVKIEYKDMDFDGLLGALDAGKVDIVLSGMTPNEERKKSVDFSELFYEDSNVCVVKKGKEDMVKSADDLKNLKVGVQSGTTQADYVTNKLGITSAKQLKRVPDLMMDLQNGNIDVIVTGKNVANINIGQYDGLAIGKTTVGQEVAESTAAAIKKSTDDCDNTSLVKSINDTIKRLKDDNKMDGYMQDALKLAEEK